MLLDSLACPDYAFEEILNWARNSYLSGFDFNPKCKKRSGNLKWMYESIHNSFQMLPSLKTIDLPDPLPHASTMDVIYYDFVPQILSLLQDKELMSATNLVLDPTNPLAMFLPDDGRLGEALSGSVYKTLYHELVKDPSKQLLCPLICYTDATQIDTLSRFSIEPFLFTIAILSQSSRCKASAWRPFGYVQHIRSNLRSDNRILSGAAKARNYHAQLSAMLESLKKCRLGRIVDLKMWTSTCLANVFRWTCFVLFYLFHLTLPPQTNFVVIIQVIVKVSSVSHVHAMFHLTNWMILISRVIQSPGMK